MMDTLRRGCEAFARVVAAALLAIYPLRASCAGEEATPAVSAAEPAVELSGITVIGSFKYAAVQGLGDETFPIWRAEGDVVNDVLIAEIRSGSVLFRSVKSEGEKSGYEFVVPLKQSVIVTDHVTAKENMTAEQIRWLNSDENPMLRGPGVPPNVDLSAEGWSSLSASEKRDLYRWWLDHGWYVSITLIGTGDSTVMETKFQNIFQEERQRAVEENRREFLDSLPKEQLELYVQWITSYRDAIGNRHLRAPFSVADRELMLQASEQSEIRKSLFMESLSPEQLERYEQISDFTSRFPSSPDEHTETQGQSSERTP